MDRWARSAFPCGVKPRLQPIPAFVPLGAPVWLDMDRDVADGLWIAQDTGGAIKGANRFRHLLGRWARRRARSLAG